MQNIALFGCGIWGRNILRDLHALGARVAVVDPDAASREQALDSGASDAFTAIDNLKEVDGVIVATPAATHFDVIQRTLPLNVPIFCEKPFTINSDHARTLCDRAGDRIHLMHIWRYHPGILSLAEIAKGELLGEALGLRSTRANWTSPRADADALWNLAPHDLTIFFECFGHWPTPRFAHFERRESRIVGVTAILGDRPFLALEASNRYVDKRREVRLHCARGVAVLPGIDSPEIQLAHDVEGSLQPRLESVSVAPGSALRNELDVFLKFIAGEGPPPKDSAADGLAVVECLEAMRTLGGGAASR